MRGVLQVHLEWSPPRLPVAAHRGHCQSPAHGRRLVAKEVVNVRHDVPLLLVSDA